MRKSPREKFIKINEVLIAEAQSVVESKFNVDIISASTYVDIQLLHKWWAKVKSFGHLLGASAKPWHAILTTDPEKNTLAFVRRVLGTLEAIKHELENDYLETFTQLVRAETFSDLLDQAQHLFDNGYFLAAGVIGRAVLEEHLRVTCDTLGCAPSKQRPTINDFNQALYASQHYSKTKMKQVDHLASIGNDAAHNKPNLNSADVKRMLLDLPEVIESTSA